ncbi:hypothetical protein FLA_5310 [Filimonas lacunae]|nr:hypothetical protein FLA_5310 [Filimonas lacunae]
MNEAKGKHAYSIPEGYFNTLPEHILAHLYLANEQIRRNPYQAPTGYFDTLSTTIVAAIHQQADTMPAVAAENEVLQELREISPLLSGIPKHNPYSIPEGYFSQITTPVATTSAVTNQKAKVIPVSTRVHKLLSYATAAALIAIMAITAFMFSDNFSSFSGKNGLEKENKSVDVKKAVSVLTEDEIVNYLSAHPSNSDVIPNAGGVSPDIQRVIKGISEEEISRYLQENSEPGESAGKGI